MSSRISVKLLNATAGGVVDVVDMQWQLISVSDMTSPVCLPSPALTWPLIRLRVIWTLFAPIVTPPLNLQASYVPDELRLPEHECSVVPAGTPVFEAFGQPDVEVFGGADVVGL